MRGECGLNPAPALISFSRFSPQEEKNTLSLRGGENHCIANEKGHEGGGWVGGAVLKDAQRSTVTVF